MNKAEKKKIIAQYEAIRRLDQTNMLDKTTVQVIAFENRFFELVRAIEEDYEEILNNYKEWIELINEDNIPEAKPVKTEYRLNKQEKRWIRWRKIT